MNYPETTGHNNAQTSIQAAEDLDCGGRDRQLDFCEEFLMKNGAYGCTGEELKNAMNNRGFDNIERSQASARLSDLTEKGLAYSTSRTRRSAFSGKHQMVYVHRHLATVEDRMFHEGRKKERGKKTSRLGNGLKTFDDVFYRNPHLNNTFSIAEKKIIREALGAE